MITVRLFARLREQAGTNCEQVDLSEGSVLDVYRVLLDRHPGLESNFELLRPARNQEFAGWEDQVRDGDELAFIPPVSGGAEYAQLIELTVDPLDGRRTEAAVAHPGAGAIVTFTGIVRDNNRGEGVTHLEYEAYEGMAEGEMNRIANEISERWPGNRVAIVHRTGRLEIGEASVVISVSAPRRAEAFQGCRHAIERIKESVPIWKREFADSGEVWLEGPTAKSVVEQS
ncbi:MAG: molybdenum cofactor biosynthesis protein MoaE [Nitrospirota bacterium]|nr:molybdenum cofactor biosynthesis protein MoaE [Nitrospirota bacterium]